MTSLLYIVLNNITIISLQIVIYFIFAFKITFCLPDGIKSYISLRELGRNLYCTFAEGQEEYRHAKPGPGRNSSPNPWSYCKYPDCLFAE